MSHAPILAVLLVEDDRAWAMLTTEAFAEVGPAVAVEWCSTGRAAIERLRTGARPDVVLLDLNLPDLGGLDVLRALRDQNATIPVIVLSASAAARDRDAAARHGATAYREKPTSYLELRSLASEVASGTFPLTTGR